MTMIDEVYRWIWAKVETLPPDVALEWLEISRVAVENVGDQIAGRLENPRFSHKRIHHGP